MTTVSTFLIVPVPPDFEDTVSNKMMGVFYIKDEITTREKIKFYNPVHIYLKRVKAGIMKATYLKCLSGLLLSDFFLLVMLFDFP